VTYLKILTRNSFKDSINARKTSVRVVGHRAETGTGNLWDTSPYVTA
jgi:hypothetical protein